MSERADRFFLAGAAAATGKGGSVAGASASAGMTTGATAGDLSVSCTIFTFGNGCTSEVPDVASGDDAGLADLEGMGTLSNKSSN